MNPGIFFSLKKKIMENFLVKKFIEIENTYGENIHPYILDIKGNDLEKSFKKQLIKYFISREILLNMYNYVY